MSRYLLITLTCISLLFGSLTSASTTLASGTLTATQSGQPGQVIVTDENGVMYLTNDTVPGEATNSTRVRMLGTPIRVPKGFASNLASWINAVLSLVMLVAGLLVLLYLVWGALTWITSGGDKGKIEAARNKMIAAVVGLIIVSASYAILLLVIRFLGFEDVDDVFENTRTIDNNRPIMTIVESPSPSPTPTPTPTPNYSNTLRELNNRN